MSPEPFSPDHRYGRDDQQKNPPKPGLSPRPATEPAGSEKTSQDSPTATNPATGEEH